MDTHRSSQNQKLIREIRQSQRAAEDLRICEIGITPVVNMANLCMAALTTPMLEMIGIDVRTAARDMRNARALLKRIGELRASLRAMVAEDPALTPIIEVSENGFLRTEHNIFILRDYAVGMSGWQPFALMVRQHIDSMRRYTSNVVRRAKRARMRLVVENEGLIRKVANESCRLDRGRYDEMLSIANTYFVICMEHTYHLDSRPSVLFTTYAKICMQKRCLSAMAAPQLMAHIPQHMHGWALGVLSGEMPMDASDIIEPTNRRAAAAATAHDE